MPDFYLLRGWSHIRFSSFFAPGVLCFDLCITHTDTSFLVRQMLTMPEHALENGPGRYTGSAIGNAPGRCQETCRRSHEHICNFFMVSLPSRSHHGDVLKSYTQFGLHVSLHPGLPAHSLSSHGPMLTCFKSAVKKIHWQVRLRITKP